MKQKNLRRIIAGASAIALTAGLSTVLGAGTASAEPESVRWVESNTVWPITYNFGLERTISDTNPAVGNEITVSTRFHDPSIDWYLWSVTDVHDSCLTYVPDSATYGGTPVSATTNVDSSTPSRAYLSVPSMPSKRIGMNTSGYVFEAKYTVGENCGIGAPLDSTVHFTSSALNRSPENKGPIVRAKQATSTTDLTISPAPQAGATSTLTATVTPAAATGEVEFFSGTTRIGKANLADHKASITWTPARDQGGRDYSITAKYLGDTNRTASESAVATGTIAKVAAPKAPEVSLSSDSAQVGETVTATINTEAGASVAITVAGRTHTVQANGEGVATYPFQPTKAGLQEVSVTSTNDGGTSPATVKQLEVVAAPANQAIVAINPAAPIEGDTVELTVSQVDANSTVTIAAKGQQTLTGTANNDGIAVIEWKPTAGTYELVITTTVGGAEQVLNRTVTVTEKPTVDPGPGDGDDNGTGSGSGSLGSLGSVGGSLSSIFGSLS